MDPNPLDLNTMGALASIAGLLPTGEAASYAATKHAVVGLSKALRIEAAEHGVQVTALCPGVVRTPILTAGKYGRMKLSGILKPKTRAAPIAMSL